MTQSRCDMKLAGMVDLNNRSNWAGFDLDRPLVMGVLNVTPDSFSDGGRRSGIRDAVLAGITMAEEGADIVDVGGESTRPGASAISPEVEQARVVPVIRALAAEGVRISVDTRNAATMRAALAAGALVVNDVSGLTHDPLSPDVVREHDCPVVLMHTRGTPATMNALATYQDVVAEVRMELTERVAAAIKSGVRPERIAIDPGLGFAKLAAASVAVLQALPMFVSLGHPVMIGASRKSFIGSIAAEPQPDRRLAGSLAAALFAIQQGASILRVHDVRETVQAARVWRALAGGPAGG